MMRQSLIAIAALFVMDQTLSAEAQRQSSPIVQGATSTELSATVEELRVSNAELRARMTGLEADKASLNGKVETLEFLLSQSRDEINRMQSDDAELERLITRLERRLNEQDGMIAGLQTRLQGLQPDPEFLSEDFQMGSGDDDVLAGETAAEAALNAEVQAQAGQAGPTRIVRRVETPVSEGEDVQVAGAPTNIDSEALPQGSLGTLPASALPGEAGPLFAEAKSRLLEFNYAQAEVAFQAFLNEFGDDPQAGEAQYWLAEVLYQQEKYAESGAAYTRMIRTYPDDARAPEALAKLARSMRLVGDTEQACNALNLLPQRYPNASGVTRNLAAGERVRSGCDS